MEPASMALLLLRTQISLATSGESPSPGARPISFRNDQATFNSGVIIPVLDDGSDPPVSPPGKGLDKLRLFGAVAQCLPQPVHCLVEIVLEIDKRVGGPKSFLQLFARD